MADLLHKFRRLEQARHRVVRDSVFRKNQLMEVLSAMPVIRRQKTLPNLVFMNGNRLNRALPEVYQETPYRMMRTDQRFLVGIGFDLLIDQIVNLRVPERHFSLSVLLHIRAQIRDVLVRRPDRTELPPFIRMKTDRIHVIQPAELRAFVHPRSRRRPVIAGQTESGDLRSGIRLADCGVRLFQIRDIRLLRKIEIRLVRNLVNRNSPFQMFHGLIDVVAEKILRREQNVSAGA